MRPTRLLCTALALGLSLAATACGAHPTNATAARGAAYGAQSLAPQRPTMHGTGTHKLYVLPNDGDGVLVDALNGARRSIFLEIYMLTEQPVVQALIDAKNRGVDVEVMLEPHPFNPADPTKPLPTNHKAYNELHQAGVHIGDTNPAFVYTHAKFLSIDGTSTIVSTANFTHTGLAGNREYIVVDNDPAEVAEFVRIFQADQARKPYVPAQPDTVISPTNSRQRIFNLIAQAKHDVMIADEVVSDPALDALLKATVARGVHVRALLGFEKQSGNDPTPTNVVTAKTWTGFGVDVRFQQVPVLHAKSVVVDGQAMYVGSENLTTNSLDNNREVGLLLTDPALVSPVVQATESDWKTATPAR